MATTHRVAKTTVPATPAEPDVPGLLLQPDNPIALLLFGHGAGTPMRAPLMNQMAHALADHGIATFRYNYPYSHRLEADYTEDLIDPLDVLLATTRAAIHAAQALTPDLPLFLAGRSMSSQVMSLLLAQEPWPHVRGLILYVFPMRWRVLLPNTVAHPSCHSERSAAEPRNLAFSPDPMSVPTVAHLPHVPVPMLFIQGSRDHEFADLKELQPVIENLAPQSVRGEPGRRLRRPESNHPSGTAPTPPRHPPRHPRRQPLLRTPTPIQPNPTRRHNPSRHHHRHLDPQTAKGSQERTPATLRVAIRRHGLKVAPSICARCPLKSRSSDIASPSGRQSLVSLGPMARHGSATKPERP